MAPIEVKQFSSLATARKSVFPTMFSSLLGADFYRATVPLNSLKYLGDFKSFERYKKKMKLGA